MGPRRAGLPRPRAGARRARRGACATSAGWPPWASPAPRPRRRPGDPLGVGEAGEPAVIEGVRGTWRVDPAQLGQPFRGRAALLSPLDRLVFDRKRLAELFEFDYQLEMYKPAASRRWGYWAMPVLHGDRFVGKLDATADHRAGVLRVHALHEDVELSATARAAVEREVADLATWLGLELRWSELDRPGMTTGPPRPAGEQVGTAPRRGDVSWWGYPMTWSSSTTTRWSWSSWWCRTRSARGRTGPPGARHHGGGVGHEGPVGVGQVVRRGTGELASPTELLPVSVVTMMLAGRAEPIWLRMKWRRRRRPRRSRPRGRRGWPA